MQNINNKQNKGGKPYVENSFIGVTKNRYFIFKI